MSGHPLILIVAPRPVAREPFMVRRRLGQHDLLLQRRRCLGHDDRIQDGRGGRARRIPRRHRSGSGRGRYHRIGLRVRRRGRRNQMRFRLGNTSAEKHKSATTGEHGDKLRGRANGGRREQKINHSFHFTVSIPSPGFLRDGVFKVGARRTLSTVLHTRRVLFSEHDFSSQSTEFEGGHGGRCIPL
jgi:hypothetical protein